MGVTIVANFEMEMGEHKHKKGDSRRMVRPKGLSRHLKTS
jgi:hypothetical protein